MSSFSVLVLMSTYNGDKYIREQLDSILNQEGVDVYLLVRDDGSQDSTCEILSEYSSNYANVDWISGDNVGFVKSFSALVRMALDYEIIPDFYAFADQDDIWFPEKLKTSCLALNPKDSTKPLLFSCNSMRIDTNGNKIGLFHEGAYPAYQRGNVLVFGTEQGCSMTCNRKAAEIYAACEPQIAWHDKWMYLICYFLGDLIYEHRPLFYYRIHGGNALAREQKKSNPSKGCRLYNAIRFYLFSPPITNHLEMAREFFECFEGNLSVSDRKIFRSYISYRYNIYSKIYLLCSKKFQHPFPGTYEDFPYRRFIFFNLL